MRFKMQDASNRGRGFSARAAVLAVLSLVLALTILGSAGNGALAQVPQGTSLVRASGPDSAAVLLGDLVPMGKGILRSWVHLDENNRPRAVGATLTEEALTGLPASLTPGITWREYLVDLPPEAKKTTPFDHIGVNWYPDGHIPKGIYDVPHFDVHLYMITPEERDRITFRGKGMKRLQRKPPSSQLPEDYMYAPRAEEPGVGAHWVDPNSPEFHGEPFTYTFFYGSYNGEVIFLEPMVTKKFLQTHSDTTLQIKQPEAHPEPGYYPITYSIRYDPERGEYSIVFGGLTERTGEE